MNTKVCKILRLVVAVLLVGCAGQTEQLSMQQPTQGAAQPPPPAPEWTQKRWWLPGRPPGGAADAKGVHAA